MEDAFSDCMLYKMFWVVIANYGFAVYRDLGGAKFRELIILQLLTDTKAGKVEV